MQAVMGDLPRVSKKVPLRLRETTA